MSDHYYKTVNKLDKMEKTDQDDKKIELSSQEKNVIFYEQITVIMNIIPKQRFSDQPHL